MTRGAESPSVLDRPAARLAALAVAAAAAGVLLAMHWEDIFPPERPAAAGTAAFRACLEARVDDVEGMLDEGVIDEGQAARFRGRAEAYCRAQEGRGEATGGPSPPQTGSQ